jgi:hypothetical protein
MSQAYKEYKSFMQILGCTEDRDLQIANYAQDFVSKLQAEPVASVETLKLLHW